MRPTKKYWHFKRCNWGLLIALIVGVLAWIGIILICCHLAGCSIVDIKLADKTHIKSFSFLADKSFGATMYQSEPNSVYFHIDNLKMEAIRVLDRLAR